VNQGAQTGKPIWCPAPGTQLDEAQEKGRGPAAGNSTSNPPCVIDQKPVKIEDHQGLEDTGQALTEKLGR